MLADHGVQRLDDVDGAHDRLAHRSPGPLVGSAETSSAPGVGRLAQLGDQCVELSFEPIDLGRRGLLSRRAELIGKHTSATAVGVASPAVNDLLPRRVGCERIRPAGKDDRRDLATGLGEQSGEVVQPDQVGQDHVHAAMLQPPSVAVTRQRQRQHRHRVRRAAGDGIAPSAPTSAQLVEAKRVSFGQRSVVELQDPRRERCVGHRQHRLGQLDASDADQRTVAIAGVGSDASVEVDDGIVEPTKAPRCEPEEVIGGAEVDDGERRHDR